MFADSLLDSHWANRSHRGWTTLVSFGLQALAVAVVIVLPLIYTEGLPQLQLIASVVAPAPPPGPPPAPGPRHPSAANQSNLFGTHLMQITSIPKGVQPISETEPPSTGLSGVEVPGGTGDPKSTWGTVFKSTGDGAFMPAPPKPSTPPIRVSRMMEGNLIYKVQPVYPPLARAARIQGSVVLKAVISRVGTIEGLQTLSGHPMLIPAARDAVAQWRYRPYLLNGEPVEVETQVTVNFILGGG